jgi:transposase
MQCIGPMNYADESRRDGRVKNAIIDVHYRGSNLTQCGRSKMCMIKFPSD